MRRRSRSDIPPQIPNFSPWRKAYSRHSDFTSQPPQPAFPSLVEAPRSGKKRSGSTPRQFARSCQRRSVGSTSSSMSISRIGGPPRWRGTGPGFGSFGGGRGAPVPPITPVGIKRGHHGEEHPAAQRGGGKLEALRRGAPP